MNVVLPQTEASNPIFAECSPFDYNKIEINSITQKFEKEFLEKLSIRDLNVCKTLAKNYVPELVSYLNKALSISNTSSSLPERYGDRFLNQLNQFLPRIDQEVGALGVPDGCVISRAKNDVVVKINSLLAADIAFVKSKEPRTDFAGYDRCKVYQKRKFFNQYSKLARLSSFLQQDPEYTRYVFNKGYYLHSFTLHFSTSSDVVHHQFGLWREKQYHKHLSTKYLQSHYDPDPENIKSIFYLSSVQALSQGPFKYFKGSAYITNENILERAAGATMCGINLLETHENRAFFAALPDKLLHHNIFGSLLEQQQLDQIELDKNLLPVFGDEGTFILFDPLGIHSGGLCSDNETRLNLQMIFKKR